MPIPLSTAVHLHLAIPILLRLPSASIGTDQATALTISSKCVH
jgi:hypothetical protein